MKMNASTAFPADLDPSMVKRAAQMVQERKDKHMPVAEAKNKGRLPSLSTKKDMKSATMKLKMFKIPLMSSCVVGLVMPMPFKTLVK